VASQVADLQDAEPANRFLLGISIGFAALTWLQQQHRSRSPDVEILHFLKTTR
jgi:hypothetical protein